MIEPYCSFRNHGNNCVGPFIGFVIKTRIRFGKKEKFTYHLCSYHEKVLRSHDSS